MRTTFTNLKRLFFLTLGISITASATSFSITQTAHAGVDGWDAGNIITDAVFENKNTMNTGDIQAFLNSKVSGCDTWGTQISEYGGGTRRQWAEARGYSPPYTCMKDYSQDGKSAAQIINDAAKEYSINPQVLIVLLQKEQSLVTDTWPLSIQYRSATGYGCPDTAACDAEYYGFKNQVRWAARMFRAILNDSPTWYTPYVLGANYIRYNPDASCGGSNVTIQNRATQALYNYTPYQPNQGALDAGWGMAGCGAYGNRNFYLYFTGWFGSTRKSPYVSLESPRWMKTSSDTQKKNPWTQQVIGASLPTNTQLKFVDKILVDGVWYLRTEFDQANGLDRGIPQANLAELAFEPLQEPRFMELALNAYKMYPRSWVNSSNTIFPAGTSVRITSKIFVNDRWFYRTDFDERNNIMSAFSGEKVRELTYKTFDTPRYMRIKSSTQRTEPARGTADSITIATGTQLKFSSKTLAGTQWFYRTEADTDTNANFAISSANIEEIPYTPHEDTAKWYQLKTGAKKIQPVSGIVIQPSSNFTPETPLIITNKITVNSQLYYRTKFDSVHGYDRAFPVADLEEIPYVSFQNPRDMRLTRAAQKVNPKTGATSGVTLPSGTILNFTTKIFIDGRWYYRTASDTTSAIDFTISSSYLDNA
jgi:hypothetical protein